MTLFVASDACIEYTYSVTFITHNLMDCSINDFPFPRRALDICPTYCMFLVDLNAFMNCTLTLISTTRSSFPLSIFYMAGWTPSCSGKRFIETVKIIHQNLYFLFCEMTKSQSSAYRRPRNS